MKQIIHYIPALLLAAFAFFATSCEDNEDIIFNPDTGVVDEEFDAIVDVNVVTDAGKQAATFNVPTVVPDSFRIKVTFTSTDENMERLYITKNVGGLGAEPFKLEDFVTGSIDKKGDGSVNVENAQKNGFTYDLTLPLDDLTDGTVVYQFWTTSGKGDFRDVTKRLVGDPVEEIGIACITVRYGTGTDADADIKGYSVRLEAPLADGSSETFFSLFDGELHQIDEGAETAAFWDFGYSWLSSTEATLSSVDAYNRVIIDIEDVANAAADETFNKFYFNKTTLSIADFDAIGKSSDLDGITATMNQAVEKLEVDDIIEFVDQYGTKGLIRIVAIEPGFGSGDYIDIKIKVQP